ncbi:MAG TPA: GNAT family N-acetyltransferase [Bacteriovoracaceae bacterium]|nr:GNAT family N-acetyltransferase [Bacteriovoracaceae bacterium]
MQKFTFINAIPADAVEISNLLNSAYRGEGSKVGWTTEADLVSGERTDAVKIESLIKEAGSHFILCIDIESKYIIGCVHVKQENSETAYFGMLAVRPNLQANGIGKALIRQVQEFAISKDHKQIRITVINLRDEILAFYNRLGFMFTGREEVFPLGDLVKVKGLKLLELIKKL